MPRILFFAWVGYMLWRLYHRVMALQNSKQGQQEFNQKSHSSNGNASSSSPYESSSSKRTPWEVLEISPAASPAIAKAAYQEMIRQYHPDKVAELGQDLQQLAEERSKEINAAYADIKKSHL